MTGRGLWWGIGFGGLAGIAGALLTGLLVALGGGRSVLPAAVAVVLIGSIVGAIVGAVLGAVCGAIIGALRRPGVAPIVAPIVAGGLPAPFVVTMIFAFDGTGAGTTEATYQLVVGFVAIAGFAGIGWLAGQGFARKLTTEDPDAAPEPWPDPAWDPVRDADRPPFLSSRRPR